MAEHALETALTFRDGEHARLWLLERLDRLEESVFDAADLTRISAMLAGDALTQLESDPLTFRRAALVHLRDALSQLTDGAAARTEREGFNVAALERVALSTIGASPAHGHEVLAGLAAGLRGRVAALSTRGNEDYEAAQADLDDALAGLDHALDQVIRRWERAPFGFWGRLRRRRRLRKYGLDRLAQLPDLQLALTEAAREQRGGFESAWANAARAGIELGIARSYSDIGDWLGSVLSGLEELAADAARVGREAGHRLERLDGRWREPGASDQVNLLTYELLDRVLDQLGLDAAAWLKGSGARAAELGKQARKTLAGEFERWAERELERLPEETLERALRGFQPEADATTPLVHLLTAGQPLVSFNDDLHRLWPEGLPAQYHLLAEASDASLQADLSDACVQVGLPAPLFELADPPRGTRQLELRVLQLVSGLGWISESERLMPMVEVHQQVMTEADDRLETREGLRAALRDAVESEELDALLPPRVTDALRSLRGLRAQVRAAQSPEPEAEAPEESDDAIDDEPPPAQDDEGRAVA